MHSKLLDFPNQKFYVGQITSGIRDEDRKLTYRSHNPYPNGIREKLEGKKIPSLFINVKGKETF